MTNNTKLEHRPNEELSYLATFHLASENWGRGIHQPTSSTIISGTLARQAMPYARRCFLAVSRTVFHACALPSSKMA